MYTSKAFSLIEMLVVI
ncbi:MAG TPA: prepilin-type N-terminal cleavage/methylation domain-containing protein, partial [Hydrogenobaculum sp.]|nr:prepilin-type N-terminal cleavage/methylation domain-containing protein [Hydrogenobaculum sp.]